MNKSNSPEDAAVFQRGLAIARRNLALILVCVLVVPIVAYGYSKLQTKEYTASSSLLFANSAVEQGFFGLGSSDNTDPIREAATNLRLATVEEVSTRTAKAVPGNLDGDEVREKVTVAPEGESELINVAATDESPAFAARLANTYSRQVIAFSRELEGAKVVRAQKLAEAKLGGLSAAELEGPEGESLTQRVRELETVATVQTGRAELAQPATVPDSPSSPQTKRNVALGILLGILLAIGAVLLREQFDRRIRDSEELEDLFGVPILGTIPESSELSGSGGRIASAEDGAPAEAFRMLRANLRYFNSATETGSLLFTSGAPLDGKTLIAWNVARAEAASGQRVLLIEADLRRPTLSKSLGVTSPTGLGLVLAGAEDVNAAITMVKGVDLLPSGPLPPNPGGLLEGRRMTELLKWAEGAYDRVIIDTPPASLVADAVPLFRQVGGVVVVARLRRSDRDAAEHLRDQLHTVHAPLLGVVVNGAPRPADTGYYAQGFSTRFDGPANGRAPLPGGKSERPAAGPPPPPVKPRSN